MILSESVAQYWSSASDDLFTSEGENLEGMWGC